MIFRWRILVMMVAVFAGLSSMAGAQGSMPGPRQGGSPSQSGGPPQAFSFKWWQDVRFKTELSLTPDQCKRADDVYQGILPRMAADKDELDRLEKRLSEVVAGGVLPEADVVKLIDQVETARAHLMIYRLRQLLTPDQRTKMKAMHDAWEKERRQGPVRKRLEGMPREGGLL
jgi:hypothetical protein